VVQNTTATTAYATADQLAPLIQIRDADDGSDRGDEPCAARRRR
jgi:hypothetical protein